MSFYLGDLQQTLPNWEGSITLLLLFHPLLLPYLLRLLPIDISCLRLLPIDIPCLPLPVSIHNHHVSASYLCHGRGSPHKAPQPPKSIGRAPNLLAFWALR